MVQDYFSLYSKDKTFLLLRIHHKVDFSDEITWSHCWDLAKEDCFDEITDKIFAYLTQGFDCIDSWQGDQVGWHESIKHLGFCLLLSRILPILMLWIWKVDSKPIKTRYPLCRFQPMSDHFTMLYALKEFNARNRECLTQFAILRLTQFSQRIGLISWKIWINTH